MRPARDGAIRPGSHSRVPRRHIEPHEVARHRYLVEDAEPVDIADFYSVNPIPSLRYRIMAAVGDEITPDDIAGARSSGDELVAFALPEQLAVQVMHHGPPLSDSADSPSTPLDATRRAQH